MLGLTDKSTELRHGRHCVFLMHVHLVFVTKYRRGVFSKEILEDLHAIFASVCHDFEATLVEFDGEEAEMSIQRHSSRNFAAKMLGFFEATMSVGRSRFEKGSPGHDHLQRGNP